MNISSLILPTYDYLKEKGFKEVPHNRIDYIKSALLILDERSRDGLREALELPEKPDICFFDSWSFKNIVSSWSIKITTNAQSKYLLFTFAPQEGVLPIELPIDQQNTRPAYEGDPLVRYTRIPTNEHYLLGMEDWLTQTWCVLTAGSWDIFQALKLDLQITFP